MLKFHCQNRITDFVKYPILQALQMVKVAVNCAPSPASSSGWKRGGRLNWISRVEMSSIQSCTEPSSPSTVRRTVGGTSPMPTRRSIR